MRSSALLVIAVVALSFCYSTTVFGISSEALQALHKKIGGDLMLIRKQHSDMQPVIYGLLDRVGQLYTASKRVLLKKNKYKLLFKNEYLQAVELNKSLVAFKKESEKLQEKVKSSTEQLQQRTRDSVKLSQAKESLEREKELFLQMKDEFEQQRVELVRERDALLQERDQWIRGNGSSEKNQESKFEKRRTIMPRRTAQRGKIPTSSLGFNS
mgnify:CR=1 FL=1|jgi:hypothetical protein